METDRLAKSLTHLGINSGDYRVLKLLPLVYTAWSKGTIEPATAQRIVDMARIEFELSTDGMKVLERWLSEPLPHDYVLEGLRDLYDVSLAVDDMEVESSELPMLLAHAEAIARTSDRPESITRSGERTLHEIAALLHVDSGETWSELLRELKRTSARPVAPASGKLAGAVES